MAGEPGFEPGLTESESVGLPLTYSPVDAFLAGGAWWRCDEGAYSGLGAGDQLGRGKKMKRLRACG